VSAAATGMAAHAATSVTTLLRTCATAAMDSDTKRASGRVNSPSQPCYDGAGDGLARS
jgi:hypothetical protein